MKRTITLQWQPLPLDRTHHRQRGMQKLWRNRIQELHQASHLDAGGVRLSHAVPRGYPSIVDGGT